MCDVSPFTNIVAEVTSAPVPEKLLSAAVLAAQDIARVREFVNHSPDAFKKIAAILTDTLNAECSTKIKTSALVVLANLARYKLARDELYNCLKRIDTGFEETLLDKEKGSGEFGMALGKIHATMLVLMMRVFGYRVSGPEVLEYASEKTVFALELLIEIMKIPTYETEVLANCCTALSDISTPGKAVSDAEAKKEYAVRVELFTDMIMSHNLVAVASAGIKKKIKDSAKEGEKVTVLGNAVHASVFKLCMSILNLYFFSFHGTTATALRQSLLVSTDLLTSTLPRYINTVCDEIYRCVDADTGTVVFPITAGLSHGIAQVLRIMSLGTFHLGTHNHALRPLNLFTCRLLGMPFKDFVVPSLELYSLLLHFNVNIDSLGGEHGLGVAGAAVDVPEACTSAVIIRMIGQMLSGLDTNELQTLWKNLAQNSNNIPLAKDNISYDLLSHLYEVAMTKRESSGAPDDSERASPRHSIAEEEDAKLDALDARMRALEATHPDMGTVREALQQTPPAEPLNLRLLGDLPALGPSSPEAPKQATVSEIEAVVPARNVMPKRAEQMWNSALSDSSIPKEFLCAINGHLLKHPMKAPSGHIFEKETIDTWIKKVGCTNPISGEPLTPDQLQADDELSNRILEWQITQNSAANTTINEDDLYAF